MQTIPLTQIPAQTLNVTLNGQDCTIAVYWRLARLYLDLSVGTDVICQGAICQNAADIIQSRSPSFAGTLRFFDTAGDQPPRWDGLRDGAGLLVTELNFSEVRQVAGRATTTAITQPKNPTSSSKVDTGKTQSSKTAAQNIHGLLKN